MNLFFCLSVYVDKYQCLYKEVGFAMVPFWLKPGTDVSEKVWAAQGSVKYTQDCFELGCFSTDNGQKENCLSSSPSFSNLIYYYIPHHNLKPSLAYRAEIERR